ncbi:MAG: hypothetical protein F7B20_04700 [Aeropyrum sp.]|nr:hypothetical protein [Aeropyrum sp.]MCE4616786.1 hypothetical protein [Aeropyrum sp.]
MARNRLLRQLRDERRRNMEDVMRQARWEAEMVRKLGKRWFEIRDRWLLEAWRADREMWRIPAVREALVRAIMARDRLRRRGVG